jgi:hypothetical protein
MTPPFLTSALDEGDRQLHVSLASPAEEEPPVPTG